MPNAPPFQVTVEKLIQRPEAANIPTFEGDKKDFRIYIAIHSEEFRHAREKVF